jgi:hypothetical protein
MQTQLLESMEAEYRFILTKEVGQQLEFEDLISKNLIIVEEKGDSIYFCFECAVSA